MYGLIGKKLAHSFSADFFNKKFADEGIPEIYLLFPLPSISEFPELLKKYPHLKGLNVTIPYKQEVIPFLDILSEEAKEIGAVNVIKFIEDEGRLRLKGFNTDCIGFQESLKPFLREDIKDALILGTGGASKAVAYTLKKLGIRYKFVSRRPAEDQISYKELSSDVMAESLLIVNTTPLGMYPNVDTFPPLPYSDITERHVCYDLVYNPDETMFMKKAKKQGAIVKNGLEMLHLQALAAWEIWNQNRGTQ